MEILGSGPNTILWGARALAALLFALALGFSPNVHLSGLAGAIGMYAVTDGVLAMLSARRTHARPVALEGVVSIVFGFVVLLGVGSQQALLITWSVRNVVAASSELLHARTLDGPGWLHAQKPDALYAYAALSALVISVAFLVASAFGYGAVDMHSCIAGQLGVWSLLIGAHAWRTRKLAAHQGELSGARVSRV